ncbi:Iron-sulfur cluster carrier protein [uncultured archaeon]|nr:Iron-sulfur cluster carrier protein [uncultured archaeon]
MGVTLSFISLKGGVGKTTIALETASVLANDFGKKVLLVDGNFSAPNIHLYLDLKHDSTLHNALNGDNGLHAAIYEIYGMDVVPASLNFQSTVDPYKLKKILEKHKHRYDFIIIDSSPHHSEMLPAIAAADKIFVVTTPDDVTLNTSMKAASLAKKNNVPIEGVIINKVRHPRYELDLEEIEKSFELPVLARIKDNKKLIESYHQKVPISVYDSMNEISKEIKRFAGSLAGIREQRGFLSKLFGKDFKKESVNRELMRQNFYESQFK